MRSVVLATLKMMIYRRAPAKAPAKSAPKAKKAPTAWQQFVKEFSKTYKGDNKDRLKDPNKPIRRRKRKNSKPWSKY